jgi:hypothetical protein
MRGRIDATPAAVKRWAARFDGREVHVAVEACTGWLFVCDALAAAGAVAHLAEPVETRALRGRKRRAKTDREGARWLRELLTDGRLPEAWIPPEHVRQWRSRARMRHTLPAAGRCAAWRWKYRCVSSRSDGVPRATTVAPRGFSGSRMRLIVPPLPAASRPSKSSTMRSPVCLIQALELDQLEVQAGRAPSRIPCA